MPPRPRLTTGPLPATTTIYKTVQCLFIGTLGYKYSTQRERGTLYTLIQYVTCPTRTHAHTQTEHRIQRRQQQQQQLWPGGGCGAACRNRAVKTAAVWRANRRGPGAGWQFTPILFRLLLSPPPPLLLLSPSISTSSSLCFYSYVYNVRVEAVYRSLVGRWCWEGKTWKREEEGGYWVGLARRLITFLQGLFALVLTTRAGRQNPLHKVFGPPGN